MIGSDFHRGERMSIKFQIFRCCYSYRPGARLQREGDPLLLQEGSSQVQQDFVRRQQRIERTPSDVKVRMQREDHKQHQSSKTSTKTQDAEKTGIDIR